MSANDDIVDRKRKDRCQPEPHKSKSKRRDRHQRSSQDMENQVMNHSPTCWLLLCDVKNDDRRRWHRQWNHYHWDVIELKQVALWHGDKRCICQGNEAAAEGVVRPLEHATTSLDLSTLPSVSSPSHPAHSEACENPDTINAGDSVTCGGHCSPRYEGASGTNRTVPRGKDDFPLAPFPFVDVPGGHSYYHLAENNYRSFWCRFFRINLIL